MVSQWGDVCTYGSTYVIHVFVPSRNERRIYAHTLSLIAYINVKVENSDAL